MNLDKPTIDEALETLGIERPRTNKLPCPNCGSNDTPALHLYEDHFYCFSCGKSGDSIGLIALQTGENVRTVLKRYNTNQPLRTKPRLVRQDVHKAVKRQWRDLHDWWFAELHRMYAGSQMWAFERALDLYSDMFDTLTETIEGWWDDPPAPFEAEKAIVEFKAHLERAVEFEERAAQQARLR